MASVKNLRSNRSTGAASTPTTPHSVTSPRTTRRSVSAQKTGEGVFDHASTEGNSTTANDNTTAEVSSTDTKPAESNDDDEMTDVFAPSDRSGLLTHNSNEAENATVAPELSPEEKDPSQAGLTSPVPTVPDVRNNGYENSVERVTTGRIVDDLGNYELHSELGDDTDDENDDDDDDDDEDMDEKSLMGSPTSSMGDFDVDNDEGYDDIDNISNDSEDSRAFEAEVEREIQAEGELGIDWDDRRTYEYNENWNTGLYDLGHADSITEPMADFDLYEVLNERLNQSGPRGQKLVYQDFEDVAFGGNTSCSSGFDTPDSSPRPSLADPTGPAFVEPSQVENLGELDGDETDDDEELEANENTLNSPSSEEISIRESRLVNRRPQPALDESDLPPLRRIACNPRRAVVVRTQSSFGSCIQYLTPRGRAYRWVTLRRSAPNSRPDSVLSSPTMINFDEAIAHGNTRTGAHVTDIIHGYAFSLRHCQNQSLDDLVTPNRFYERFHTNFAGEDWTIQDMEDLDTAKDDMMQLVDFSACIDPATDYEDSQELPTEHEIGSGATAAPLTALMPAVTDDMLRASPVVQQTPQRDTASLSTSLTAGLRELPLNDSSSPKKRRRSQNSHVVPDFGMSPLEKKTRLTTSNPAMT